MIDQITDDTILQAHLTLLNREVSQATGDFWADLSSTQQASIDRGLADPTAGRREPFADVLTRLAQ